MLFKGNILDLTAFTDKSRRLQNFRKLGANNPYNDGLSGFSTTTSWTINDAIEVTNVGGSVAFDGTGDYLYINSSSDFDLESGAYTLEFWVWFNSRVPGTRTVVLEGSTKTVGIIATGTGNNDLYVNEFGTANVIVATGVLAGKDNQWLHIAVSSDGTTRRLFLDGSVVASTTNSLFDSGNNSVGVGGNIVRYSGANLNGYISNLRVVKGTALYTSNFTPPTAPLTAITNTSLLLNFTNGGIIDNASKNVLETVGNAQISTSVKKFGTGSLAFDGSGDYLKFGSSPYTGFGTGDFTIEAWVYLTSSTVQNNGICDCRYSASATGPLLYYIPTTGLLMFYNGDNRIIGGTISINTWTHVALARSSGSTKLYIDGTQVGSTYSDSNNYSSGVNNAVVGAFYDGSGSWNGYIDDLRITRGVARYTANFTPPTEAFFDR